MIFLRKLARRLARLKTALIVGTVATGACELPLATDQTGTVVQVQVSPKTSILRTGDTTQFTAVGLTKTGDTVAVAVSWSVTGGMIMDTSTTGHKSVGHYKSPSSPGRYKVVARTDSLTDTAVVDVNPLPVASVTVTPASAGVMVGQTVQLTATTLDSTGATLSGRALTWASSNSAVATVDASGLVTGTGAGSATITATSEGKSGTSAMTVSALPVASVGVNPVAVGVTVGQTAQLTATPRDANGNALTGRVVTWGTSNSAVATVNGSGLVTGVAAGSATITATSEGKSGIATVTVTTVPVATVGVSPASASVTTGQTLQLTATPRDANGNALTGRVVTWASSDAAVATVNGSGLVTAVAIGSATITATSEGKSGTSSLTVTAVPVATVGVSPASASLTAGQTVQLTATPRDANGNALTGRVVTWASSNAAVATVNGSGLVTGVAAGSATITATSEGKNGTSTVTVTTVPVATVGVSPVSVGVTTGQTAQLTATPRDANGNALTGRVVTWGSSNTAVATVNGSGLVTGVAAGSATITATSEGKSGTSTVTVTLVPVASVTLSPASASVMVAATQQLTATLKDASGNALTGRAVTWGSSASPVATVNGSGMVTGVLAGTATITATSEGQGGTAAITVTALPPPGTWPNEPAGFTVLSDYGFSDPVPATNQGDLLGGGWHDWWNTAGRGTMVTDATAPMSPSSAYQFLYPIGFPSGQEPAMIEYVFGARPTELYWGFWWKPSSPFQSDGSGVNKIAFVWTPSGSTDLLYFDLSPNPWRIRCMDDLIAGGGPDAGKRDEPNVTTTVVTLGQWHRIEIYVKYSTGGNANGIVKWWVDGVLNGNYTNLKMVQDGGFDHLQFAPTFGGNTGDVKTEVDTYRIDHVHLSRP